MNRKTTITLFYAGVALISAAILGTAFYLRSRFPKPNVAAIVDAGREAPGKWFEISSDLHAINQDGKQVKLSDLRGKVWLVAEFFAVCPQCAERNGEELRKIYDEFGKHPDFHIVCITVDPENDRSEKLADYAKALGAHTRNWWFLNAGDEKTTHEYLENTLKFMGVRERRDPLEIKASGRFAHDLAFQLVDREFNVLGKWPLADARSEEARQRDPELYQKLRDELFQRIRDELEKNESPGI
jgi:protein SCO1